MKERFEGEAGCQLLEEALHRQKTLLNARDLIPPLIEAGTLLEIPTGERLIAEGAEDTDVFLILAGTFEVRIKGNLKAQRGPGDIVGDFVGAEPSLRRTASLIALEANAVMRVSLADFRRITTDHADFWKSMHAESNKRVVERNEDFRACNEVPRILIFSSSEAKPIMGQLLINLGGRDDLLVEPWDQIFAISSYPVDALLEALERADFAIAIATGDDALVGREKEMVVPRDNVTFEYGLAIGMLGLNRALLLVDDREDLRLASDSFGLTYVPYRNGSPDQLKLSLRAACERILEHVLQRSVRSR